MHRAHGYRTFQLVQTLSGHGYFGKYPQVLQGTDNQITLVATARTGRSTRWRCDAQTGPMSAVTCRGGWRRPIALRHWISSMLDVEGGDILLRHYEFGAGEEVHRTPSDRRRRVSHQRRPYYVLIQPP